MQSSTPLWKDNGRISPTRRTARSSAEHSIADEVGVAPAMASIQIADALPGAVLLLRRPDTERGALTRADVRADAGPTALLDTAHLQDLRLAGRISIESHICRFSKSCCCCNGGDRAAADKGEFFGTDAVGERRYVQA